MYTISALRDTHARVHQSFEGLLEHCGTLTAEELNREVGEGFAYPTVRLQLHHMLGAEDYWTGVLMGSADHEDNPEAYPTHAALADYRVKVWNKTQSYLQEADDARVNTAKKMMTWGNRERELVPALVLNRIFTHGFQHQGQIVAMCRAMGKPKGGLDFPII